MSVLRWREELSLGIDDVDREHKELVELIGRLQRDLQAGANTNNVIGLLREIYTEIAAHFANEEKLMRLSHYRAYADHKEDHETLLDDLRDIIEEVEDDGVLDESRLTDDLDRWFSDHFQTHDAKLHRLVRHC